MELTEKTGAERALSRLIFIVAVAMSVYHLAAANFTILSAEQHINLHIAFALVLIFLQAIQFRDGKCSRKDAVMIALVLCTAAAALYIHLHSMAFQMTLGRQPFDKVFSGLVFLIVILIATEMTWGPIIPLIAVIALLYGYFGAYMPGIFFHGGLNFPRLITYVTTNFTGVYGMLSSVSANTIVLFTIFAGLMESYGAIGSIMDVAMSASTKIRSGGAQVAVLSSGLIGSITGSVAANITLTGSVSIPLMKKRGYPAEFAAACEASASTGGAILPPVMNAAAFIISSWTSIPYIYIVFVGITPALLYYLGIALSVYIKALKLGDEKVQDELIPQFHSAFRNLLAYLIPIVVLVALMMRNYSPQKSLYLAALCLLVIGLVKQFTNKEEKPVRAFLTKTLNGLAGGAKTVAGIAAVMAAMGCVVEILTATGLPSKISQFALALAGNHMLLLAVIVAVICLIFGMGMPSGSAYILAALLGAPALTSFGVPVIVAHFFVFYFAELSALTPPVAIGCLVASGLANAKFLKTCATSIRLAIAGFVLPFLFLYRPALLAQGSVQEWAWAVVMVVMFLFAFIVAVEGYFRMRLNAPERILAGAAALCCLLPVPALDVVGIALCVVFYLLHRNRFRKSAAQTA